jgi:hypothetical protein
MLNIFFRKKYHFIIIMFAVNISDTNITTTIMDTVFDFLLPNEIERVPAIVSPLDTVIQISKTPEKCEEDIQKYIDENKKLIEENIILKKQKQEIKKENDEIKLEKEILNKDNEEIKKEKEILNKDNDELMKENERLKLIVDKIIKHKDEKLEELLRIHMEEIRLLKEDNFHLNQQNGEYFEMAIEYKNEFMKLAKELNIYK